MSGMMGPPGMGMGQPGLDPTAMAQEQPDLFQMPGVADAPSAEEDDIGATDRVGKRESDKIMERVLPRFDRCVQWEAYTRPLNLNDLRFVSADADNSYQWPDQSSDLADEKVQLTINETRRYCLKIITDIRENRPAMKARATGGGATYDSAMVFTSLFRNIEYNSSAADAYDLATEKLVKMGIGYWRVVNDYPSNNTFDQEIFIRRIPDPLTVYLDPDIQEPDGSDARFGFIFDDVPKDLFDKKYPQYKKYGQEPSFTGVGNDWFGKDHIRVAEYYEVDEVPDTLYSFVVPQTGERMVLKASEIPKEIEEELKRDPDTKYRRIIGQKVFWYFIIGHRVVEKREVPCRFIPIVRAVAEEDVIDGNYDRKGHVRNLKDPQRMLNYWSTSAVEHVALQSKTPWAIPAAAAEGYEDYWSTANTENHSFLPWKHIDGDGNQIPPPQRQDPPVMAPAYIQGMELSRAQMMAVAGQYEAVMGEAGPELSGKAITERKKPGDQATNFYAGALARAIRHTGRIVIDMAPKIYDTKRLAQIIAEDGSQSEVMVDPAAQQAYLEKKNNEGKIIQKIFNPTVGIYDVQASTGPGWGTRREEAYNTLTNIMTLRPELAQVIGDLIFRSADFPMADEAAERLKRMVPLQALGDAPPPEVQQLQSQVQNLTQSLASAIQALANKEQELATKADQTQINTYKAETDRFEVLLSKLELLDPNALAEATAALLLAMQNTPLPPPALAQEVQGVVDQPGPEEVANQGLNSGGANVKQGLGVPDAIQGSQDPRSGPIIPDPTNPGGFAEIS